MSESSTRYPAMTQDEHRLREEGAARVSEPFHPACPQRQDRDGAALNSFDPHVPELGLTSVSDATTRSEHSNEGSSFSVRYDGRRYEYDGYYYDRVEDALFYARLTGMKHLRRPEANLATGWPPTRAPDDEDSKTMSSMGITFEAGRFHFREFHYDRLDDAVNYAKLVAKWPKADGPR